MRIQVMMVWLASAAAVLAQGTLVVPNGLGNVEGNSSTVDPFTSSSFRFQQIYGASQFPSGGYITHLSFRIDAASTADVLYSFGGSSVQLSTTTRTPDSLSPMFAENIGSDVTTVRNGAISFGGVLQPGASPQPFGQVITFSTPFFYNPAQGNLLVDIVAAGGLTLFPGSLDAQSTIGDSVSTVFATSDLSGSGTPNTLGLVTRFTINAVPEPGVYTLLFVGGLLLLCLRASPRTGAPASSLAFDRRTTKAGEDAGAPIPRRFGSSKRA